MNLIKTDARFSPGYNSPEFYYQRSAESKNKFTIEKEISNINLNSVSHIDAKMMGDKLRAPTISNYNINNAIGLVQSVASASLIIENKLGDMKTLIKENNITTNQTIKKIEESIISIANDFTWNGIHYMAGVDEGNQKAPLRKLIVNTEVEAKSSLKISFKSFNPTSAVGSNQNLGLATLNLSQISNVNDLDTHAYGSAVLYSNFKNPSYLDTHTKAMREQAVIQIDKAIDGVKSERMRLEGYLTQLNSISENNQSESLSRSNYEHQNLDVERAYKIALFLENEMPKNVNKDIFPLDKLSTSRLNELLH